MQIGFHTDAFNSSYWCFDQCLQWASNQGLHYIECGTIDGVSWIHGLGYQPHVALWEDPLALRLKMDKLGIEFSQLDAAFPLSRREGLTLGVEYILHSLRWAHIAGCPRIDTTDDRFAPQGMTEREALDHMRRIYQQIVPAAELYGIVINIEPHGCFTTKPDFVDEMLRFVDSLKEISWDQISKSDYAHLPRPEDVRADMEPPVRPGPDGTYPVYFTPGVSKLL